jgi:hypothetical protein
MVMLSITNKNFMSGCRYAERHGAECRCAECRGANFPHKKVFKSFS